MICYLFVSCELVVVKDSATFVGAHITESSNVRLDAVMLLWMRVLLRIQMNVKRMDRSRFGDALFCPVLVMIHFVQSLW